MQPHQIEIMAPVGSFESLYAAIQGGANSVYFGVGKLNMRSRSSINFSLEDLAQIVSICKEHHIKSYLTLNTVMYNEELDELKRLIDAAKEHGVTAVIGADMAVLHYAKQVGVEIHISTQCNVSNTDALAFYAQYAEVIVLARELSLKQIMDISTDINTKQIKGPSGELVKIELFAHGALCMAVSGKCYLSLDNKNYSANRGACLQQCRKPYKVTDLDGGTELIVDNEYIMSPKDLNTLPFLDKLIKAGVSVFKLEGRGRAPEYVKTITRCYREAADACLNNTFTEDKIAHWQTQLHAVYNRGFWEGYYLGKEIGEWSTIYGSQAKKKKVYAAKCTNYFSSLGVAELLVEAEELHVGDDILITGPTTGVVETTIEEIRVNLEPVKYAPKGVACSIKTPQPIRRQDKVYKWINSEFYE